MAQPSGRYELFAGEVIAMRPERAAHAQAKLRIAFRLYEAVEAAGVPCQVYGDGMAVGVDEETVFEPDAMVRCGPPLDGEATLVTDPVIVVEVLSPSTRATDSNLKLEQYFRLPSVHHYLIVRTTSAAVIHHRRTADGIAVQIVLPGTLRLDPPGILLRLD
jgi:Uma2 family endonuclease